MGKKICIFLSQLFIALMFLFFSQTFAAAKSDSKPPDGFRVLDISERTYDNGPAIAVLVSEPLDIKIRHDAHLRISDTQEIIKSAWVLSDDGRTLWFPNVDPEQTYSISVLETLKSAKGHVLGGRVSKSITTRKITPIVSFASEGFLLPAKMSKGLPIVSVNVNSVNIEFFQLNEKGLVKFVNWKNTTGEKGYYELSSAKQYGELVFSGRFDLNVPKNRRTICHVSVEDIEALQKPGVYMAVMREPGEYDYDYQAAYFLVTDIGLHARAYKTESLIFASSLKTGAPLSGVELSFYDREGNKLGQGKTNAEGRYDYPHPLPGNVHLITASHENQTGVLPMKIPALDMSEFELGNRKYRPREIFIYSPRNLYRPGETVIFSALLRDDDGWPLESLPLTAKLYRPDGRKVKNFTWRVQDIQSDNMNYYQTSISLPGDAQTGIWEFRVWDDPSSKSPANVYKFHVEEFLPERMKLELSAKPEFPSPGETLNINVSGQYLYGATASGNEIRGKVRVKAKRDLFENLKGFQFGNIEDENYKDYWELSNETLDSEGSAILEIPSRWEEIRSPVSVRAVVDLFETGGRPVTRAVEKIIWPGKSLVGIRPLFDEKASIDAGPVNFEIVKAKNDGTLEKSSGLMVELIKEDRDYYWEYSESTGWLYKYTEKTYQFLTESLNLEADKASPYTLQLKEGQYVLAVKDPESNLTTSIRFRVGYWWQGDDSGTAARPDKVVLTLDKPAYSPGDIINLTVTPPHGGQAIIAVEGEKPLWIKRIPVSGKGTSVEIPMLAGWNSHNLYITAVVFRPADAKEKITPNRAAGLIHLPMERAERKLDIEIEVPEKLASQGPVSVKLKLKRKEIQETFVTLAAVDVGILNITDFKTPDPFTFFFEKRRYDTNAYDIYSKVIENMEGSPAALRYGGDADLTGGKRPESNVKLLSLFQSPVLFDENGEAWISFDLPDFNGRIRFMAVAFNADQFGSAEKEATAAAPIVTQLAKPRFMAPGDSSNFTLDIHNISGSDKELNLVISADGPIDLKEGEKSVKLADGEKTTLRFPVTAKDEYGSSRIKLELTGSDILLEREWSLGVRPGYPASARKVFKSINKEEAFSLDPALAADMIPATVDAEMKISSSLPLDFQNAMKGLIAYPYGCLEQTTSRAWPLLHALPEQVSRYHLPVVSPEERLSRLNKAVERLAAMQLTSGGFGLWNKNSPEAPWLTVFAADFMLTARDMSIDVPETVLDKTLERMEIYMKKGAPLENYMNNTERAHLNFAVRSYAAYVLSRVNRASLGTLRILYDNYHKNSASCLPLAHIGIALKNMGDTKRSKEALELAVQKRPDKYGFWGDYGSLVRDLSLTLALFVEYESENIKGFDTFITDLDNALRQRQWMSTQEKYAVFKAGIELSKKESKEWKGKLTVSGNEKALQDKGAYIFTLTSEEISGGVSFVSESPELLYASAIIEGYTKTPPQKDDSRISISRDFYDLQGNPVERTEFRVGELLLVHLKISAKEFIPDALVVDFLPAGFEAENQNLKHSFKMDDMEIDGKSIWKLKEQADILHEEYRDDRYAAAVRLSDYQLTHLFYLVRVVSPGTFSMPPAFAESMYRPEIRGIGETPAPITILNKGR